jgi:hypothetical protein
MRHGSPTISQRSVEVASSDHLILGTVNGHLWEVDFYQCYFYRVSTSLKPPVVSAPSRPRGEHSEIYEEDARQTMETFKGEAETIKVPRAIPSRTPGGSGRASHRLMVRIVRWIKLLEFRDRWSVLGRAAFSALAFIYLTPQKTGLETVILICAGAFLFVAWLNLVVGRTVE